MPARLRARWAGAGADVRRYAVWSGLGAGLALLAYVGVLWDFGPSPLRAAFGDASFSNFYDVQARSFLDGRLDVPQGELGIEAFVIGGRDYMYFPPGPAIARMPLLAIAHLDGRLTAPFMLAAWALATTLTVLLVWRVRRILRPAAPLGRLEAAGYGIFVASATGGSVVLFLASLPFVYHEAYSWAIASALGAAFCLLGFLERPRATALAGASAFTLMAVLSRTTAGWAFAGVLVLVALWLLLRRPPGIDRRWAGWLVAGGLAPLAVGVAFNWAKFRHPYMFPLEHQVWTDVNERRRLALEANGGDLVSLDILPSTFMGYFRPDGIRFTSLFPFITLPGRPAAEYGPSFLDQSYRTGSVTAFMPLLLLLAAWGLVTALRPGADRSTRLLRFPLLATALIPGAIMFYGYIAYRYTSEFVPVLVLAGAVALVDLARRLEPAPRRRRSLALGAVLVLAAFGFVANLATAVGTSRVNNPGPPLQEWVRLQERVSRALPGDAFGDHLYASAALPADGPADRIQIVGDCDAVYVGTGDLLWPWMPLELRELAWEVDLRSWDGSPVELTLALPRDFPGRGIVLRLEEGTYRGTFDAGQETLGRRARPLPDRDTLQLRLVSDLTLAQYVLVDVDDARLGLVDIENSLPTADWFRQQLIFDSAVEGQRDEQGVTVRDVPVPPLDRCRSLVGRAQPG